jgi:hypothetical protein
MASLHSKCPKTAMSLLKPDDRSPQLAQMGVTQRTHGFAPETSGEHTRVTVGAGLPRTPQRFLVCVADFNNTRVRA